MTEKFKDSNDRFFTTKDTLVMRSFRGLTLGHIKKENGTLYRFIPIDKKEGKFLSFNGYTTDNIITFFSSIYKVNEEEIKLLTKANQTFLNNVYNLTVHKENDYVKNDVLEFSVKEVPSCCGVQVIHNFQKNTLDNFKKKKIQIFFRETVEDILEDYQRTVIYLNEDQEDIKDFFIKEFGFKLQETFVNYKTDCEVYELVYDSDREYENDDEDW